jgi:glycogen operon protein
MICAGDEVGRTQGGNNNAYCQDNETSWLDWSLDGERQALLAYTRRLIRIRAEHPALRRAKFFKGRRIRGADVKDIMWLRPDGGAMSEEDWKTPSMRALGMFIAGNGLDEVDDEGEPIRDDDLLLLVNAAPEPLDFVLTKDELAAAPWELLVDTSDDAAEGALNSDGQTRLEGRSLRLFRRRATGERLTMNP